MRKGSIKRQTAETLMNAASSRSHTVFTVTVHIRETTRDGEELLRIGKLNLVDLAGAENVGRSGAVDKRAREAGNINQSLLTLGRVISSLVEHAPHVPYRESKLTRLLQDSLGGRTKTSIIATVSPAVTNYEESLSTLEYAYRARSITNKPELNQKISKTEVLKEYGVEMKKLEKELHQVQAQNGVWLAQENWLALINDIEENEKKKQLYFDQLVALEILMEQKTNMFENVERDMLARSREIAKVKEKLVAKETRLEQVQQVLEQVAGEKEEQEHLVKTYMDTEVRMTQEARQLAVVCHEGQEGLGKLHTKKETIAQIESANVEIKEDLQKTVAMGVENVVMGLEQLRKDQQAGCARVEEQLEQELERRKAGLLRLAGVVEKLAEQLEGGVERVQKHLVEEVQQLGGSAALATSQILEEGRAQSEASGAEYTVSLLPLLVGLATAVQEQSLGLEQLQRSVGQQLGEVSEVARLQMAATTSSLREVEVKVQQLHQDQEMASKVVVGACGAVTSSHAKLHEALKTLQANHKEHEAIILAQLPKTLLPSTEERTSSILHEVGVLEENVMAQEQQVNKEVEKVNDQLKCAVEEGLEYDEVKSQTVSKINAATKAYNQLVEVQWTEVESKIIEENKTKTERLDEVKEVQIIEAATQVDSLQHQKTEVIKDVEKSKSEDAAKCDQLCSQISTLEVRISSKREEARAGVEQLGADVTSYLEERMGEYTATGQTPVRRDRRYPRYLTTAEPQARLLERFRYGFLIYFRLTIDLQEGEGAAEETFARRLARLRGCLRGWLCAGGEGEGVHGVVRHCQVRLCMFPMFKHFPSMTSDLGKENKEDQEPAGSVKGNLKRPDKRKVFGSNASVNSVGK